MTFNIDEYLDNLPVGEARPENFEKELEDLLRASSMRAALAGVESIALLMEKQFMFLDFTTPEGVQKALEHKGKIAGIQLALTTLVGLTEKEEK